MNENKKEFRLQFGGKEITVETGRLAKQADGAVLVTSGGTQVLVTVCGATDVADGQDFFPLLVDYKEKYYSAGKFLGGYMKREGRPSDPEILLMRMIDRPLRPLFPEGFMNEVVIMAQVLSYDANHDPEVLAGLGASCALTVSDIPFQGPLGFCKVGRLNGQYVLNPSVAEWHKSDLELVVAASPDAILMIEGEANLISEADMLGAIQFAHKEIKEFCKLVKQMEKEVGRTKRQWIPVHPNEGLLAAAKAHFESEVRRVLDILPKQQRQKATAELGKKFRDVFKANPAQFGLKEDADFKKTANSTLEYLLYNIMRADILKNKKRIGGRGLDQVRAIETEISVLKKVHGSSLFTRGETQVLAAVTMGGKEGEMTRDRLYGEDVNRFYLHYQFPPYSVGEAKGYRGVGRREIGHGNLAERAVKKVLPTQEEFPYVLRVNCEVLESNGSSSMGSVCSASMALMDAGVPIKGQVAGVAMGLIKEGNDYAILTDILGDEDALGDMDFKVAGTKDGISAIQMDIKISGLSEEIFKEAMEKARIGRLHILDEMNKTMKGYRTELKDGVPRIRTMKIATDQIGMLIGPGGKNIRGLQETYQVSLECAEDGTILCIGPDTEKLEACLATIAMQINGPEVGKVYTGTVVTIKEYGAFVDLVAGVAGLLHVSEISDERVKEVSDFLREGDLVDVKVLEVDRFGKMKLSAKAHKSLPAKYRSTQTTPTQQ